MPIALQALDRSQWRELTRVRLTLECRRLAPAAARSDLLCAVIRIAVHCCPYVPLGFVAVAGKTRQSTSEMSIGVLSFVLLVIGASCLRIIARELEPGAEFRVVNHLPVGLTTLGLARLTTVVAWQTLAAAALVAVPASMLGLKEGLPVGLAVAVAAMLGAAILTCLMVALQICAVGLLSHKPIRSVVTASQLVVAGVAGIFTGLWQLLPNSYPGRALIWCYPPYWLTGLIDLTAGVSVNAVGRVALVAAAFALAASMLTTRWAQRGLHRLTELDDAQAPQRPSRVWTVLERLVSPQVAAILQLARRYQEHDLAFRLGLIAWLPGIVITFGGGVLAVTLFTPVDGAYFGMWLMSAPAMAAPTSIYAHVSRTTAYRAAWLLALASGGATRLMLGGRDLVFWMIALPCLLTVGIVCRTLGMSGRVLAEHLILTALVSYALVTFAVQRLRLVPFCAPIGAMATREFVFGTLPWVVFGVGMATGDRIYRSGTNWTVAVFAAAVLVTLLEISLRRQPRRLEVLTDGAVRLIR